MDNVDLNVLRQVAQWTSEGHAVALVTITRTWGSAPRPPGSVAAIRGDGRVAGSVSGGCIEDDLIDKAKAGALSTQRPHVVTYGIDTDTAQRFGLPCGGMIELVLEPVLAHSRIADLLRLLERGERVQRVLNLASGDVALLPAAPTDVLQLTETTLTTHHGPRWRLVIVGAGQMAHYLAQMAQALDYQVTVCDPREEYITGLAIPGVALVRDMPDDMLATHRPDGHTAIVALSHDPKLDDLALMQALTGEAFYVGAIGSRANQAKRRARLKEHFGLTEAQLDRLHGPVGLRIGARTPPEIAVAILAELTAVRYGVHPGTAVPPGAPSVAGAGCVA